MDPSTSLSSPPVALPAISLSDIQGWAHPAHFPHYASNWPCVRQWDATVLGERLGATVIRVLRFSDSALRQGRIGRALPPPSPFPSPLPVSPPQCAAELRSGALPQLKRDCPSCGSVCLKRPPQTAKGTCTGWSHRHEACDVGIDHVRNGCGAPTHSPRDPGDGDGAQTRPVTNNTSKKRRRLVEAACESTRSENGGAADSKRSSETVVAVVPRGAPEDEHEPEIVSVVRLEESLTAAARVCAEDRGGDACVLDSDSDAGGDGASDREDDELPEFELDVLPLSWSQVLHQCHDKHLYIRWSFASPVETWARTWLDVGERRRGRHSGPVPLVSSPGLDLVVLRHPSPPGLDLGIRLSALLRDIELPSFIEADPGVAKFFHGYCEKSGGATGVRPIGTLVDCVLRVGTRKYHYPSHQDWAANALIQIVGCKSLIMFAPDTPAAFARQSSFSSQANQRCSLCGCSIPEASALPCGLFFHLRPGDMLTIPPNWWHAVDSASDLSVATNFFLSFTRNPADSASDANCALASESDTTSGATSASSSSTSSSASSSASGSSSSSSSSSSTAAPIGLDRTIEGQRLEG